MKWEGKLLSSESTRNRELLIKMKLQLPLKGATISKHAGPHMLLRITVFNKEGVECVP